MLKGTRLVAGTAIAVALAMTWLLGTSDAAGPLAAVKTTNASKLSEDLYDGLRGTSLLESSVFSKRGEYLGRVRNAIISRDGQIEHLVVEGGGPLMVPEFVFRVPWNRLGLPVHTGALIADLSDTGAREYGLFLDPKASKNETDGFQMNRLIGDYARLQTGQGFGYVTDLVFSPTGKMMAVLVARDKQAGGGTIAFPYPDKMENWSPSMSYYGLPYITAEQANQAGMAVKMRAFSDTKS
ncbi:PRC-barrel domain-containing protein [Bradyrhizobium sp. LMTR 3]|uniref:PRC-barrel domain-containing protein n=1 Tax=Bradyrhizobium sp. LMTR 3 TaxID=189873 RepID=UPI000810D02F|nr:PRC-barrel domain-containing protein [Bradyrhizobium sp. LMTR 3]OCK55016.1 hypothetical protein LMTR3_09585 [Bradyrhizobium sp. LMTR 3]